MIDVPVLMSIEAREDVFDFVAHQAKDGMNFVEIGSFIGGSICYFGQKLRQLDKHVNLTAVDTWKFDNISTGHLQLVENNDYYQAFLQNVAKCGLSVQTVVSDSIAAAEKFDDESIDFLFIDGCHEYPYTENELKVWLPKMKKNSVIAGHDYEDAAIKKAVANVLGEIRTTRLNHECYLKVLGEGLA